MKLFKYFIQDSFYTGVFNYGIIKARTIQGALKELDKLRVTMVAASKQNLALHELVDRKSQGALDEVNDPQKLWSWWQNEVPRNSTLQFTPCGVLSVAVTRRWVISQRNTKRKHARS